MSSDKHQTTDRLADELRHAAFPGAHSWGIAAEPTKEAWRRVAVLTDARIEREVDKALREATTKAHDLGQHLAAKAIREMRSARGF